MLLTIISYVPTAIGLYVIGFVTLLKNIRSKLHVSFAIFSFLLASWLMALFFADFLLRPSFSLWALRFASCLGVMTLPFFLYFCIHFPTISKRFSRTWLIALSLPAVIFGILSFTPWLIPAVDLSDKSAQLMGAGFAYALESFYLIAGYVFAMAILFSKYRQAEARQRSQILLVLYGIAVSVFVNAVTGFVLIELHISSNYSNLLGSVSLLIFVAATSYAIGRHKLFDIRLAITRTIGFIITITFVGIAYSLLIVGIEALVVTDNKLYPTESAARLVLFIIPTIFIGLTFHPIQKFIARLTKRIFYQDAYDLRDRLDRLSDGLVASNELEILMKTSFELVAAAIKPAHGYFAVFDGQGTVYRQISEHMQPASATKLASDIKSVSANPVMRDELKTAHQSKSFVDQDIYLALRLGHHTKPSGLMLFGPKQNGRMYSQQDIDLLRIGAKNLEVAVANAQKYEQISHFAETMRQEVLRATVRLRKANAELKTLDALKDDFISMASHQLRSPATSVHEVIELLNNPSVSQKDKDRLLELATASSERLVTVINDMLSIARIQAGQLSIEASPTLINPTVEQVILHTSRLAKQKGINLSFVKPPKAIKAKIDRAKINEALSNYVENAIIYSPEASTVTIKLIKHQKRIVFEVSDQGIGVPLGERKHLFEKFYRAGNARKQQPDGNGIGLFVVRSIVREHGGETYYKPLKTGSLFGFWLPA